jgi:peptidoglycan hydrolase-like protein with peptidoglycan-binding domain
MKNIIKLTESDLRKIVEKVILEARSSELFEDTTTEKVVAIQKALIKAGYSVGPNGPDGVYGKDTKAAVVNYQKANGIKQTGFVGNTTAAKLGVQSLAGSTPTSSSSSSSTSISPRQKNINIAYCNSDGGVILNKASKLNKWKWSDYVAKYKVTNAEIEIAKKSCKKSTKFNLSPRIDRELEYIKSRGLISKPFFIYDPLQNLIYLFDKGAVLVDYSQVVDGQSKQIEGKEYGFSDWCKDSGLSDSPKVCTDTQIKTEKDCMALPKGRKASWGGDYCRVNPFYNKLPEASRFFPKGIYDIRSLTQTPGYQGSGGNTFWVSKVGEKELKPNAIHGIPGSDERLRASAELERFLQKDASTGAVPEEYLNNVKAISKANQSYGCVGVPAAFIDNPKVKTLGVGARLFVMGEDKNYLVNNASEYFDKLNSSGDKCVNPTSLAQSMENLA